MRSSKARWTMALKAFDTNSEFRKEWESPIRIERSEKIGKRRGGGESEKVFEKWKPDSWKYLRCEQSRNFSKTTNCEHLHC